jgi:hypothetical protein
METPEVLTMRAMAWQRAKGELNAMLATYLPASGQVGAGGPEQAESAADAMAARVRSFIVDIEESI